MLFTGPDSSPKGTGSKSRSISVLGRHSIVTSIGILLGMKSKYPTAALTNRILRAAETPTKKVASFNPYIIDSVIGLAGKCTVRVFETEA